MKILAAIIGSALLAGCSLAPGGSQGGAIAKAGLERVIEDVKSFNDAVMDTGLKVLCGPSVGSYFRLPPGNQKTAVRLACDPSAPIVVLPENQSTVTVQQDEQGVAVPPGETRSFIPVQ